MQSGTFIAKRLLPEILRELCADRKITCTSYSDEWVLQLNRGDKQLWVYGYHFDINGGAVSEVAKDKVATFLVLERAGIPVVPHYLVRSAAHESINTERLTKTIPNSDKPFVVKPLSGSSGKYVYYAQNIDEAVKVVLEGSEAGWTASTYQDIQKEFRVVMLDDKVELVYEKTSPSVHGGLRLFNLGLGAKARNIEPGSPIYAQLQDLASRACVAMSLRFAAVDVVELDNATLKILEINSGLSFEHYARQGSEKRITAEKIYGKIIDKVFSA